MKSYTIRVCLESEVKGPEALAHELQDIARGSAYSMVDLCVDPGDGEGVDRVYTIKTMHEFKVQGAHNMANDVYGIIRDTEYTLTDLSVWVDNDDNKEDNDE